MKAITKTVLLGIAVATFRSVGSVRNTARLATRVLLLLLASAEVKSRADTLVFLPQLNNYWPDPKNWFTVDPNNQMLVAAGRAPVAGDSATISAHVIADLTALSLNLNTLTLNSDAVVSNGLVTASKVVMFGGSNGSGTGFQSDVLTVLTEMDILGGSCGLSSTTLSIQPGAFLMLGALGVAGQLSFSSSTIYNYGQITFAANGSFLSGGSSLVNGTNAFIVASTNASLNGTSCIFDNNGVLRCDAGTFSVGQFASWTSHSGVSYFVTTSSNAVIDFPSGLTIPPGVTNYFYGPGTNEWVGGTIQGTAQIGYLDPTNQVFTNLVFTPGNLFFSGTITGTGAIHAMTMLGLGSLLIWYNATLGGPVVNIDPLSQLTIGDRFSHDLNAGSINNAGAVTWTIGPTLSIDQRAVFNNLPGGMFSCLITGTPIDGSVVGAGVLNNFGTFRKALGTNGLVFAPSGFGPAFNNSGLLEVLSGYVQLSGGTNIGTFDLSAGELWFSYNSTELNSGVQFIGTNFLREVGAGTVYVNTNVTVANFEMRNATAILDGPGNLIVTNACNLSAGTLQGSGILTIPSGGGLNIKGFVSWSQRTIDNSGAAMVAGTGTIGTQGGGFFNNLLGGVFDIQNDNGVGFSSGSSPVFNNFGLFKKSAGTAQSPLDAFFTNNSVVEIQTGTVYFGAGFEQAGGSTTVASNATLKVPDTTAAVLSGGTLSGLGTVSGALSNAATVIPGPPGTLTVVGTYNQSSLGALSIVISGAATPQYGRLAVSGGAALAGSLMVSFENGFAPSVGNVFGIVTAGGGIAGKFSNLAGMHAGNGVVLVPSITPTVFNLIAAHEPTLSALSFTGHQFSFSYPSTSGLTNIIEYTASLNPIDWLLLTNVPGDGTIRTIIDASANSEGFYRIVFQ
jgi:hypothetical protein